MGEIHVLPVSHFFIINFMIPMLLALQQSLELALVVLLTLDKSLFS